MPPAGCSTATIRIGRRCAKQRKARRLARLAESLPRIRRSLGQYLAGAEPSRELALAARDRARRAAARSAPAARPICKQRGTRGAATLLKSNIVIDGDHITLRLSRQGRQDRRARNSKCPRLAGALERLRALPGRAPVPVSQRRTARCVAVRAREVNAFLREIAGINISLKDFRTLIASAEHAGDARPRQAGEQRAAAPQAGAGGDSRRRRRSAQHAGDLPAQLRARRGDRGVRGWRAGAFSAALAGCRSPTKARAGAGADRVAGVGLS